MGARVPEPGHERKKGDGSLMGLGFDKVMLGPGREYRRGLPGDPNKPCRASSSPLSVSAVVIMNVHK